MYVMYVMSAIYVMYAMYVKYAMYVTYGMYVIVCYVMLCYAMLRMYVCVYVCVDASARRPKHTPSINRVTMVRTRFVRECLVRL